MRSPGPQAEPDVAVAVEDVLPKFEVDPVRPGLACGPSRIGVRRPDRQDAGGLVPGASVSHARHNQLESRAPREGPVHAYDAEVDEPRIEGVDDVRVRRLPAMPWVRALMPGRILGCTGVSRFG